MDIDQVTIPDGTGFSGSTPQAHLNRRLDTIEGKLDDIIYAIQQVEEKLHDLAQNNDLRLDD